jgi:hypothetical protein
MKNVFLITSIILSVILSGCFKIGQDEETTSPTKTQISRCFSEMCLNPDLKIIPLGYRLKSGIDAAIWFKFETGADISEIFDSTIVDTTKFSQNYLFLNEIEGRKWWDATGKSLLGGQVQLPNARFMEVGIEKTDNGFIVYIMWLET